MAYYDDLANKLALDVLEAQELLNDDNLIQEVSNLLEATSSTMHEAFMTAVRVYASEERARKLLEAKLRAGGKTLANA